MSAGAIVILAAGASSRMGPGRDKLAEDVDGQPQLTRVALAALTTGWDVYVCLPARAHPRAALLPDGVTPVPVAHASMGMGMSLQSGIRIASQHHDNAMILPADMPDLTADDLTHVIAAHRPDQITRGADMQGRPGHPVIFPRQCFHALMQLQGDQGARQVVQGFSGPVELVPLPGENALMDLDTVAEWDRWRAARWLRD